MSTEMKVILTMTKIMQIWNIKEFWLRADQVRLAQKGQAVEVTIHLHLRITKIG